MTCNIPPIIELTEFDGKYSEYLDAVYDLYKKSFPDIELYFRGMPIHHKKHPEYEGKPATFWHIISSGEEEAQREPDLRRHETVAWPFYILRECVDSCGDLLIWENERKGKRNTLLYCSSVDYLVVLANRNGYYIFWTAYPVWQKHYRKKLLNEYNQYMAKAALP